MKKLLSLLTINTLTASIPAPLLANTSLTRVKRDVITSNSNNNYLPLKEFKNIRGDIYRITIDTNDNIYFSVFAKDAFVLKQGSTTPTKINGINSKILFVTADSKDNIYFGVYKNGAFVLKQGETTAIKIYGISNNIQSITIDSK